MLSNRLYYVAKKNKKGCFNCKKLGHFIVDCLDLQKEKSKDKSKKSTFKSNKIKKQINQSLIDTWEDLDSESESYKDDVDEGAKIATGLVATTTSEAEPESDSEEENEVYYKIPREELIESLKQLLTYFELRTNELNDLKEKYVDLMKQQESTLLDLKASK